ncbi:MAG: transposase [Verrucomicrobiae bacterium]|nr:transposase [Verrucomicrobiae bacterium]
MGAIQTFGQLIHCHPHIHALVTEGVFLPDGTFLALPKLASEPFLKLWEQEVFELLLAEGNITEEVVANGRSWKHSGLRLVLEQDSRPNGQTPAPRRSGDPAGAALPYGPGGSERLGGTDPAGLRNRDPQPGADRRLPNRTARSDEVTQPHGRPTGDGRGEDSTSSQPDGCLELPLPIRQSRDMAQRKFLSVLSVLSVNSYQSISYQ